MGASSLLLIAVTCGSDDKAKRDGGSPDGAADRVILAEGGGGSGGQVPADATADVIDIVLPSECQPPKLKLTRVATAREPLALAQPKGDTRLYVAERGGLIKIIKDGVVLPEPFFDMRDSIATFMGMGLGQGERGLTNLAFHPDYASNGRFYVFYTRSVTDPFFEGVRREGDVVVAEGVRSAENPEKAEATLKQLLVVQHDGVNGRNGCCDDAHNGGMLAFGPDGLLYVGVGDGGGGANQYASKVPSLSKILRINVDDPAAPPPGNMTGAVPLAWAKGVRNPWRGAFDAKTGDLYFADVGEATWEEINYLPAAQLNSTNPDFGWGNPGMEGTRVVRYYPYVETGAEPYGVLPLVEYVHPPDENPRRGNQARAAVGGVVYRGGIENMDGRYFFADYPTNTVWSLLVIEGRPYCQIDHTEDLRTDATPLQGITGFAQDQAGALYVFDIFGNIYRIEKE